MNTGDRLSFIYHRRFGFARTPPGNPICFGADLEEAHRQNRSQNGTP
jgi:hypothetical protein